MRMHVIRNVTKKTIEYRSREDSELFAYAQKSYAGIFLEKLVVQNGEHKLFLEEEGALLSALNAYCPWFPRTHWSIYEEKHKIGSIKPVFQRPRNIMSLNGDTYEIGGHSREVFSLVKNRKQIAVWKKSISYYEKCDFTIDYIKVEPSILFMTCVMCDRLYYPGEGKREFGDDYSTFVPFDNWKERAEWHPPVDSAIREKLLDELNIPNDEPVKNSPE
ncbi:MAG: hypothetical protein E7476_14885 [Ruminococcaceae bacterium]|nr:hypothetical protein [Oscillospiraceae bacterium]